MILFVRVRLTQSVSVMAMLLLASCSALDPYINPYYDDDSVEASETDRSTDRSPERNIENIARTRDGPSDEGIATLPAAEANSELEQYAQDENLLATAGPNPFYASAEASDSFALEQFKQGVVALQAEDWSIAAEVFGRLSERKPKLSNPWLYLGLAQLKLGETEAAETSLNRAIEANSTNQEAYNQLGLLYRQRGEFRKAESSYQTAIKIWPAYPAIRRNLGILYESYLGDLEKALQQYTIYQTLLPEPDRTVRGWIADLKRRMQVSAT